MFSNSTLCSAQNVSSVTECCSSSSGGIPCVGSSCPSSGWSFVPHDPDCGGDPEADCRGTCTEIELVKGQSKQPGATSVLLPPVDPGGNGCGGGSMDQGFGFLIKRKKDLVLAESSYPYTSGAAGETGCCMAPFEQKLRAGVIYGARVTKCVHSQAGFADMSHPNPAQLHGHRTRRRRDGGGAG